MKNPWKKLSSKQIYDNPWIKVREDKVLNPASKEGIYGVVEFKNLAIGIVPIDNELNTYLIGQYRYPLNEYSWEIPEGGSLLQNNPLEGAKRELKEETGLTAHHWEKLCDLHTSNSVTNETGIIYIARELEQGKSNPDENEDLQVKKIPLNEAVQWVMEGKIKDSLSMIALLMVDKIMKEQ